MFNWVCPHCGKDVPPSKTECPYCHGAPEAVAPAPPPAGYPAQGWPPQQPQQAWTPPAPPANWQAPAPQPWQPPQPAHAPAQPQGWQPPPPVAAPPVQQQPVPPPANPAWPPPAPQYAHAPAGAAWAPPPQKAGIPAWLLGVGFAVALLGALAALYFGAQRYGHTNLQEKAGLENPANPSQQKVSNSLQKVVEVVGIRMVTQDKKPTVKFVVVNHSSAEIAGLVANVTLWASTSRSEEDSIGSFTFKLSSLGPNASKEVTEPLKTKLKPYELPDWQNATAEIQITSPQP